MPTFVVVLVGIALAALIVLIGKLAARGRGTLGLPYRAANALFSPAERAFLGVLDQAVGPEHRVFGKVRLADLASVTPGLGNAGRRGALNRIAGKHVDFVVCRAGDLGVVCAIELDDRSHEGERARGRDALVDGVCRVIGLPLLRVRARHAYVVAELRQEFLARLSTAADRSAA